MRGEWAVVLGRATQHSVTDCPRSPRRQAPTLSLHSIERLESRTLCNAAADASLAAWFRADAITAAPGAVIASWVDSSGHGLNATQPTAARRPRFFPDGLNSRPSVRFDAAASTQLSFARPVSADFTIVVAFGSRQGVGRGEMWYDGAGLVDGEVAGVADDFGVSLNRSGQVLAGTGAPDASAASGLGFDDGRAHVATFTRAASTGTASLHVDGKLFGQVTGGTQPLAAPGRLTIGSLQTNINYFTGDVGEIRVYSAALAEASRASVEAELITAYNVAPVPAAWFDNPVIDRDFPDPGVVQAGGNYYAFATNGNGRNVQAARSTDLVNWTALPDALPNLPSWARAGRTWAPDVAVTSSGTYVLYYTAWHRATGRQVIGVATATSPAGPFVPSGSGPLLTQIELGGSIDPSVFTDASGTRYLLWKNDGNAIGRDTNIYIQPLSGDGLSLLGSPVTLIRQDQAWEGNLVEGPTLWTHAGKYYLFYSANSYTNGAYATGYAVADALLGPYTKPAEPLMVTGGGVVGPGGPEVVVGPDGNDWMLYHSWENGFGYRSLSVDRLEWEGVVPEVRGPSRASQPVPVRPRVAGRHVFYNRSAFDGNSVLTNSVDDRAVATDKRALRPGEVATFANVTTYTRGINGVMVDVTRLPETAAAPAASSFFVENAAAPDAVDWSPGPAPASVSVRRGAGVDGSDRITLVFDDNALRKEWLRVTVRPTPSTALAGADVFSFGNLAGDTGDHSAVFRVNALDLAAVRRALNSDAPVTSRVDFNRDGRVNALDMAAVRGNYFATLPGTQAVSPLALRLPLATASLALRSDRQD